MKKLFFTLSFILAAFLSQAQLFVAGGISVSYSGGSTDYQSTSIIVDDPKEIGFGITPAVGYMLPGKSYGFGLSLGYNYASIKDNDYSLGNDEIIVKSYTNTYNIAPFFRYAFAKFSKITLYADAKFPISLAESFEKNGDNRKDIGNDFSFGARLIPGLTYKFNDHILFTTEIGLLSISYLHNESKRSNGDVKVDNDFVLGANDRAAARFAFVYLF